MGITPEAEVASMDIVQDVASLLAGAAALTHAVERLLALAWEPAHKRRLAIIKAQRRPKK